jgi:LysM repeat protein
VQAINSTALDPQTNTWGIAVFKARADLPDQITDDVTFVLFGDATLDNPTADMLGVTVSTRVGDPACVDAPNSGLLIHSPDLTQVQLRINGADIALGSCAFITAQQKGEMAFGISDGAGIITAAGITRIVPPGAQVRIPLGGDDGLQVSGPPSDLEPFDYDAFLVAPLGLAGCPAEVPPPITTNNVPPTQVTPQVTSVTPSCQRPDWTFTYVVPFGDTLSRIASSIGISVTELAQGNGISNANVLQQGQVLCVPREVPYFAVPTWTPSPTGTLTITTTVTATVTSTFVPTNTPTALPTNTPTTVPTSTPLPTNTPVPTSTGTTP